MRPFSRSVPLLGLLHGMPRNHQGKEPKRTGWLLNFRAVAICLHRRALAPWSRRPSVLNVFGLEATCAHVRQVSRFDGRRDPGLTTSFPLLGLAKRQLDGFGFRVPFILKMLQDIQRFAASGLAELLNVLAGRAICHMRSSRPRGG